MVNEKERQEALISELLENEEIAEFFRKLESKMVEIAKGTKGRTREEVSAELEEALKAFGSVTRVSGDNRYKTSKAVADKLYPNADTAFVVYGLNFPDGLCAGPLAYIMHAPMLLVTSSQTTQAKKYVDAHEIRTGFVIGGEANIDDAAVRKIFGLPDYAVIEVYHK